jgi:hypothetical protein
MTSTLTVGTTSYSPTGRAAIRVRLDRLTRSIDEPGTLEISEYGVTLPPRFAGGMTVGLEWGTLPVFLGEMQATSAQFGPDGWRVGYRCLDLFGVAARDVPVTNPDSGAGSWTFNLPSTDTAYVPAWAGQSVGGILGLLLANHATALAACGFSTTPFVSADLAGLTIVPPEPVTIQGPSLLNAIKGFLDEWAGNIAVWADWQAATSDWRLRFEDPATFTAHTLTMGIDPIDPPSITRDTTGCFSQVVVRGMAIVESWFGSVADGTLTPAWSTTGAGNQQSLWALADWTSPAGSSDAGTITVVTSTVLTVQSADPTVHWATNFWSANQGTIYATNAVATTIAQQESRQVTACAAMTAGGTATITLDYPLVNGGYTTYRLICQPPGGLIDVWRRYNITNTRVADHLLTSFPYPVAYANGGSITSTKYPVAAVNYGGVSLPAQFEIDPVNAQIRFNQPVVMPGNSLSDLQAGGSAVTAPTDVWALLAYGRGTLTAQAPSSGYAGTSFTVEGIQRTLYIDLPQWQRAGDLATYAAYAAMKLATVQNTVVNGTVNYAGLYADALTLGIALNIAGDNGSAYATGWESIAAPVRSVVVQFTDGGSTPWITSMALSNRRKQATGDPYFLHPGFLGGAASEVQGGSFDLRQGQGQGQPGDQGGGYDTPEVFSGPAAPEAAPPPPPRRGGGGSASQHPASPPPPPPDVAGLMTGDDKMDLAIQEAFGDG